jgi:hypothetical protein
MKIGINRGMVWLGLISLGLMLVLAACGSLGRQASTAAQRPLPSDSFGALATHKDANGKFSIDVPAGWSVQPQKLAQENMKAATAFVGREGFMSVVQFDWGTAPAEQATQLVDSFLQVTGVTRNKGYKELARLPVSPTQVWVEMEYTTSENRALHNLTQLRIDGTRISLISINFDQAVWPRAVEVSKQIINSYVFTDNKGG